MSTIWSKLGLSEKEAAVYIALLETGPATVSTIARKAHLHRPTVYQTIPLLIERQLVVRTTRGKRTLYASESPDKLKKLADSVTQEVNILVPYLKTIYASQEKKPLVKLLEGKQGIVSVLEDIVDTLPRGSVFYRYSAIQKAERSEKYLPKEYRERRDNKHLERLVITNEKIAKAKQKRLEREIKVLPSSEGLFDYEVTEIIYGDKVAFIDYNSETALLIENKKIAEFQKKLFQSLYKRLN